VLDAAVVGLGLSRQGRHLGVSSRELRRQALDAALADCGLSRPDIDGAILVGNDTNDLRYLGLSPDLAYSMSAGGAAPALAIGAAAGAIATGQATTVVCMYGEGFTSAPPRLIPNRGDGDQMDIKGFSYGYPYLFGLVGPASVYALAARRHIAVYGTTPEELGAVAIVERDYAVDRPGAQGFGQPISMEDYLASRMIVDPLRLLDCSRPTDGGAVVIVTSAARAADLTDRAVAVRGVAAAHGIGTWWTGEMFETTNAMGAGDRALNQAGITRDDLDFAQLYAPFTIAVLLQLADYGFCSRGEAGAFVVDGQTRLGGRLPVNTGGGQLSGFYATGFTPISEAILQLRGEAPSSQVPGARFGLVSGSGGNGGVQGSWAHATLVLGGAA
jgi:acetyl-CoA acetyltransferase